MSIGSYADANEEDIINQYNIHNAPAEIPLLDAMYLFYGVEKIVVDAAKINYGQSNYCDGVRSLTNAGVNR